MNHGEPLKPAHTEEEYWQALGHFIEAFAVTEAVVFLYMALLAEMPGQIAQIVCESWKTDKLLSFITSLHKIKPPSADSPDIPKALSQLKLIANLRNSVAHYPSFITIDGLRQSTNLGRTMPWKPERKFEVSPAILHQMTVELARIGTHLITVLLHPDESLAQRSAALPLLNDAWRDIPVPDQPTQGHTD